MCVCVCVCVCLCVGMCVCVCVCVCVLLIINAVLYNKVHINLVSAFDNFNAVLIWVVLEIRTSQNLVTIELHVIYFLILLGTLVSW